MAVRSAVVKLGGSVLTDKAGGSLTVERSLLERLAAELHSQRPERLIVVHGAGSYGHRIVRESGLHAGLSGLTSRLAMGETQRLQYELDAIVTRHLLEAGLPAIPVQASATAVMSGGRLVHFDTSAIAALVTQGMVPVLYGVPAVDHERGCSILSGDVIAPHVAHALGFEWMLHATDVDGIFTADPRHDPDAVQIPWVHRDNWEAVSARLTGSAAVDVTGGMARKLGELLAAAQRGLQSRIFDARVPGRLAAALRQEPVGTLIAWSP